MHGCTIHHLHQKSKLLHGYILHPHSSHISLVFPLKSPAKEAFRTGELQIKCNPTRPYVANFAGLVRTGPNKVTQISRNAHKRNVQRHVLIMGIEDEIKDCRPISHRRSCAEVLPYLPVASLQKRICIGKISCRAPYFPIPQRHVFRRAIALRIFSAKHKLRFWS